MLSSLNIFKNFISGVEKSLQVGIWMLDTSSKQVFLSEKIKAIFNIESLDDILNIKYFLEIFPEEEKTFLCKKIEDILEVKKTDFVYDRIFYIGDNCFKHTLGHFKDEKKSILVGIVKECSFLEGIDYKNVLLEFIFKHSIEGIVITDDKANIINVNPAFTEITGYTREEVLGKNPNILKSDKHTQDFYRQMWDDLLTKGSWEGEIWNRRKNGEVYPEFLSIKAVKDAKNKTINYISMFIDLSEQKKIEDKFKYFRFFDPLTGLMNRELFLNKIKENLVNGKDKFCLIIIDLDNFKDINEVFSYSAGDVILKEISDKLVSLVGQKNAARIGEDSFAVIYSFKDSFQIESIIFEIKDTLSKISIKNTILNLSCCLGVSVYPEDSQDPEELLRFAETALNRARREGYGKYRYFNKEMYERAKIKIDKIATLKEGIRQKEFIPFYQPKIDLKSKRIVGFEALARWQKTEGRVITPAEFIPLAEQEGFILPLTFLLLERIAQDLRVIYHNYPEKKISCAVNLSLACFEEGMDWILYFKELATKYSLPLTAFQVEITESILMQKERLMVDILNNLAENKILVCLDDFGKGYSSLYYLKNLPIHLVKIDRSFIVDLKSGTKEEQLVKAIIEMSKALGIKVCAEGVEQGEQLSLLQALGCDIVQGYYFSPPLDFKKILNLLASLDFNLPASQ